MICKGSASGSGSGPAESGSALVSAIGVPSPAWSRSAFVDDWFSFPVEAVASCPGTTSGSATDSGSGEPLRGESEAEELEEEPESDIPTVAVGALTLAVT